MQTQVAFAPADAPPSVRHDAFWQPDAATLDQEAGRAIGYDMALYGMRLPEDAPSAVLEGAALAQHQCQGVVKPHDWADRKWVRTRYSAWRRNRVVSNNFTAQLLREISVPYCPITREALTYGTGQDTDASCERVNNNGGYAMGNVIMMSTRANLAKANRTPRELLQIALRSEDALGLTAEQWIRLSALALIVWPDAPAAFPPVLMIPNKVLTSNAHAYLGAMVNVALLEGMRGPAWSSLSRAIQGKRAMRELRSMLTAALGVARQKTGQKVRRVWAVEDAWLAPHVAQAWGRFMAEVDADEVVKRIVARKRKRAMSGEQMHAEMSTETRGFVRAD